LFKKSNCSKIVQKMFKKCSKYNPKILFKKNQIQSQKSNQQTNAIKKFFLFFFSKSKVIFFKIKIKIKSIFQNQKYFSKSKVFFKIKSIFEIKTKSTITQINYNSHNQSKYVNFFFDQLGWIIILNSCLLLFLGIKNHFKKSVWVFGFCFFFFLFLQFFLLSYFYH